MITLIFIVVCLAAAGYFKGRLDAIADTGKKTDQWKNKYEMTEYGNLIPTEKKNHWWYFGLYKPNYAEKFPFSSTALVSVTDDWHMNQFIMYRFIYLAISFAASHGILMTISLAFVVFPIIVGIVFELSYNNHLVELKPKMSAKKSKLDDSATAWYSEGPNEEQVTSIPEKQIGDE